MKYNENEFEVVCAVVNDGFADVAMDAAREAGAKGGTILKARGTGNKALEKKYGVAITPGKELLIIIVKKDLVDTIVETVHKSSVENNNNKGIVFTLPVCRVAGLKFDKQVNESEKQ